MSVQRFDPDWRAYHLKPNPDGAWVMYTDHARIVAEATAEARAAERRHWEARFRNAEQAHAAALAAARAEGFESAHNEWAKALPEHLRVDRLLRAPHTLTADDVLAAINAFDYDTVLAATPAPKTARAQIYTLHALARDAILRLIHDGEATP